MPGKRALPTFAPPRRGGSPVGIFCPRPDPRAAAGKKTKNLPAWNGAPPFFCPRQRRRGPARKSESRASVTAISPHFRGPDTVGSPPPPDTRRCACVTDFINASGQRGAPRLPQYSALPVTLLRHSSRQSKVRPLPYKAVAAGALATAAGLSIRSQNWSSAGAGRPPVVGSSESTVRGRGASSPPETSAGWCNPGAGQLINSDFPAALS